MKITLDQILTKLEVRDLPSFHLALFKTPPDKRQALLEAIAAKLGITKDTTAPQSRPSPVKGVMENHSTPEPVGGVRLGITVW